MPRKSYDAHRDQAADTQRQASASGRDVGSIPPIEDLQRRQSCESSLRLFCETYNPEAFYWGWSPDHLMVLHSIEQSVKRRALLAVAMARGTGKTTICRMAILWAASYAHAIYPFLIGANLDKAIDSLDAIKLWMRELPLYVADFPEIAIPARAIGGIANRANGLLCEGEPTFIRWDRDRVVLPRVPAPPNLPRRGQSPWAPTSGIAIGASGLTGDGLRGSLFGLPNGQQIRPDLILLDDPQTDESAGSEAQNNTREALLRGAVLGMAGPGKRISAVMPCTPVKCGDMADRILDPVRNPLWRGIRTGILKTMPSNMEAWEKYFEVYNEAMGRPDPEISVANDYYRAHRELLDAGAAAAWEDRKEEDEISAIQHAMNLYCERGVEAFWAELMCRPMKEEAKQKGKLDADKVTKRCTGRPRGQVPPKTEWITAYVDVHDRLLYWQATAFESLFAGSVLDYNTWPPQPDSYFTLETSRYTLGRRYPGAGKDGAIYAGLEELLKELTGRSYCREDGAEVPLSLILVDTGYKAEIVGNVIRALRRGPQLAPAKGFGITASKKPFSAYKPETGVTNGRHYRLAVAPVTRLVTVNIDTNYWKSFARDRLATALGAAGALTIFGDRPDAHRMWGDHQAAEYPVETEGPWGKVEEWKLPANKPDNHLWDGTVGCCVAACIRGARLPEWQAKAKATGGGRRSRQFIF